MRCGQLDEQLSSLSITYDPGTTRLTIRRGGQQVLSTALDTTEGRAAAESYFVGFLGPGRVEPSAEGVPLRLVRSEVRGHAFHNHNGQVPPPLPPPTHTPSCPCP